MCLFFRQVLRRFLRTLSTSLKKLLDSQRFLNIAELFHGKQISSALKNAMATGNWGVVRNHNHKMMGVSQALNTETKVASLAHLRKIATPGIPTDGKDPRPRQLHTSHWGLLCPTDTPEGAPSG